MGRFRGNAYFEKIEIKPLESGTRLKGEPKKCSPFQQCPPGPHWLMWTVEGEAVSNTGRKEGRKWGIPSELPERGNEALGSTPWSFGMGTEDVLCICPLNNQKQEIVLLSKLNDRNFLRKQ